MITVLHGGGGYISKWLQYYIGARGSLQTHKSDYVICARPLSPNQVKCSVPVQISYYFFSQEYVPSKYRGSNDAPNQDRAHLSWRRKCKFPIKGTL